MDIVEQLRKQAQEIADEGHKGWGNTMLDAAEEIVRLRTMAARCDHSQAKADDRICPTCGKYIG